MPSILDKIPLATQTRRDQLDESRASKASRDANGKKQMGTEQEGATTNKQQCNSHYVLDGYSLQFPARIWQTRACRFPLNYLLETEIKEDAKDGTNGECRRIQPELFGTYPARYRRCQDEGDRRHRDRSTILRDKVTKFEFLQIKRRASSSS